MLPFGLLPGIRTRTQRGRPEMSQGDGYDVLPGRVILSRSLRSTINDLAEASRGSYGTLVRLWCAIRDSNPEPAD